MRILLENTCLVVIDIQEKFIPHINEYEKTINNCSTLIQGCSMLEMPITITEQNPTKLGSTVSTITELLPESPILEKIEFSCFDNESFQSWISKLHQKNIILCGIETHICILQTAIDLKQVGLNPIVIQDAVSSRTLENKQIALTRLQQEGVLISSCESILFELMKTFNHPKSREISKLIK